MARSRTRNVLTFLALLLALVALLAGAAVLWRLPLATWAGNAALRWQGIGGTLAVAGLDADRAILTDVRLGADPPLRARRVSVAYSPAGLLAGRLGRIEIEGLEAVAVWDEAGFRVPALQPLLDRRVGRGDGAAAPLPPVRLRDARLRLATPQGTFEAQADAVMVPAADGAIELTGALAVELAGNRLEGDFEGGRRADGHLHGTLSLSGGGYAGAGIEAPIAGGRLRLDWDPARQPLPTAAGTLTLPRLLLRDVALGKTDISFRGDGGAAEASLRTTLAEGAAGLSLRLDLQDALTPAPTAALAVELAVDSVGALAPLLPVAGWSGGGTIALDGFAALPPLREIAAALQPERWPPFEAELRADLSGLTAPERLREGSLAISLRVSTPEPGVLVVQLSDAARAYGHLEEPFTVLAEPTDMPLARLRWAGPGAEGALRLRLAAPSAEATLAARYEAAADGAGWRLAFPALGASIGRFATSGGAGGDDIHIVADGASLEAGPAPLARLPRLYLRAGRLAHPEGSLRGVEMIVDSAVADREGGQAEAARLTAETWEAGGFGGVLALLAERIAWSPERIALRGTVAAGVGGRRDGIELTGGRLQAELEVAGAPEAVEIALSDCASFSLTRLAFAGGAASGGPLRLCPAGQPLVRLGGGDLELAARLAPSRWRLETPPVGLAVDLARQEIDLAADTVAGIWSLSARGAGSALEAEALRIAADGIALDLALSGRGAGRGRGRATLRVDRIRDREAAARFAPLSLIAEATLDGMAVTASGRLVDSTGQATLALAAEHRLDAGTGSARIATKPPLSFAAGGLQPQALAPQLRGLLTSVQGLLDLRATAEWGPQGLQTAATAEATALGAQTPLAVLEGFDGKVAFTSLTPPQTAARQAVRLRRLDVGLPLQDGEAVLTLRPDGRLALHSLGWPWAGGRIHLDDEVIDPRADTIELTLRVDDVDLAELVRLLENESVELTGRIGGTIPVEIVGDSVHIRDARLASTGPGVIRYRAAGAEAALAAGGESTNLLLSALQDFRYQSLVATLNGVTTGQLDLTLQVTGANPELYDGYPVELNFTVGGPLLEMLQQGLAGYRIPDNIMRNLGGDR